MKNLLVKEKTPKQYILLEKFGSVLRINYGQPKLCLLSQGRPNGIVELQGHIEYQTVEGSIKHNEQIWPALQLDECAPFALNYERRSRPLSVTSKLLCLRPFGSQ